MKEENKTLIKALNMFGRIPEQWELLEEIEKLNKYKNFIKSINITLEPWSRYEKGYELHNITKQELYKELYELRQEILKGE